MHTHVSIITVSFLLLFAAVPVAQSECPPYHVFTGEVADDFFGLSVASAGDVNNDGYDDLIVGAELNDAGGTWAGRAYVFSGFNGDTLYVFTGEERFDNFGRSVASAGDVNNDGYDDLIVGAYAKNVNGLDHAGRAYVFSGLDGDTLHIFSGEASENGFGVSVAPAGDVNADGYADLIVGASGNNAAGKFAGRAYVFSGVNGDTLYIFTGEAAHDSFGYSVASAGDVNNDGYADLIIGAPADRGRFPVKGRAYVFSGQTGDLLYVFTGDSVVNNVGFSVATAGDVNSDGYADVIVGSFVEGRAYVYSGLNGDRLNVFKGEKGGDLLGWSVASAGDVNNDGYADMIVGANWNDAGGKNAGRAYVFSGLNGDTLFVFTGRNAEERFGISVASAGDVNADGYSDLIVGGLWYQTGRFSFIGRAYVYLGEGCGDANGDGLVNHDDIMFLVQFYFQFGSSPVVCNSGDVNSDGSTNLADIVYLAQYLNNNGPSPCTFAEPPPTFDPKKKPEERKTDSSGY